MDHYHQNVNWLHSALVFLADCCFFEEDGSEVAEEGLIDDWKLICVVGFHVFKKLLILVAKLIGHFGPQLLLVTINIDVPASLKSSDGLTHFLSQLFPVSLRF